MHVWPSFVPVRPVTWARQRETTYLILVIFSCTSRLSFTLTLKFHKLKLGNTSILRNVPCIAKKVFTLTWGCILDDSQKDIFHKTALEKPFFCIYSQLFCLSVGIAFLGHNVADATRGHIASRNLSKVERVILKFCILSSSENFLDYQLPEIPPTWWLPHLSGPAFPA